METFDRSLYPRFFGQICAMKGCLNRAIPECFTNTKMEDLHRSYDQKDRKRLKPMTKEELFEEDLKKLDELKCENCKVTSYCKKHHKIKDSTHHKAECDEIVKWRNEYNNLSAAGPSRDAVFPALKYIQALLKIKQFDAVLEAYNVVFYFKKYPHPEAADRFTFLKIIPALAMRLGKDQALFNFMMNFMDCRHGHGHCHGPWTADKLEDKLHNWDPYTYSKFFCSPYCKQDLQIAEILIKIRLYRNLDITNENEKEMRRKELKEWKTKEEMKMKNETEDEIINNAERRRNEKEEFKKGSRDYYVPIPVKFNRKQAKWTYKTNLDDGLYPVYGLVEQYLPEYRFKTVEEKTNEIKRLIHWIRRLFSEVRQRMPWFWRELLLYAKLYPEITIPDSFFMYLNYETCAIPQVWAFAFAETPWAIQVIETLEEKEKLREEPIRNLNLSGFVDLTED